MKSRFLGSVEAGGTKFVCAVGDESGQIIRQTQFSTQDSITTLKKVIDFFQEYPVAAIGVASFGPIEIRHDSPKFGFITNTPKLGWKQTNFVGTLEGALHVPIYWTTDVNGSAFGEYNQRNETGARISSLVYYTLGTGVGAGCVINGKFLGDLGHPEMGHIMVKRHPDDTGFAGICPYHGDCLEGLVSGPTFDARLGVPGKEVSLTNHVWDIMAYYVAQAVLQATLTIRPNCIVFGGGVTNETFLIKVRREFANLLNEYVPVPPLTDYISMPVIKNNGSATCGDFLLANSLIE